MSPEPIAVIVTSLNVGAVVFLVAREIVLRYIKVNLKVTELQTMNKHLGIISKALQPNVPVDTDPPAIDQPERKPPINPNAPKPKLRW